jgi:hypothetical protein
MRTVTVLAAGFVVALGMANAQAQSPRNDIGAGGPTGAAPSAGGADMGSTSGRADTGGAIMQSGDRPAAAAGKTAETPGAASSGKSKTGMNESGGKNKSGMSESQDETNTGMNKSGNKNKSGMSENQAGDKSKPGEAEDGYDKNKAREAEGDLGANNKTGTAEGQSNKSGKSARLESQDVSRVRTYFSDHRPNVKSIDKTQISVSIGVALPGTIALYDLPPDVIVVRGACPIKYFAWGDDIVLVDSCSREVVEIIPGIA